LLLTYGLESHLKHHHRKFFEQFLAAKKENGKRKLPLDSETEEQAK
jgi:hypothetical protein